MKGMKNGVPVGYLMFKEFHTLQ